MAVVSPLGNVGGNRLVGHDERAAGLRHLTHLAVEVFDGSRSVLTHHQSADAVVGGVASTVVILQPAPENTIHARKHKMYQRYSIRSFLQNYISPDSALFHLYCAILYFYRIELKIR